MLLRVAVHNQVKFRYVVNDSWYASADNMKFIKHGLKKEFVMPLKDNRKVALSDKEKQMGQYQAVNTLSLPAGEPLEMWLESVDFPLHLVKQVFTTEDGSVGLLYLVTSDLTLSSDQMTTLYQRRWSVEVYHKSLKPQCEVGESAGEDTDHTTKSSVRESVCLHQAGESENTDQAEPFRVEVKDLYVRLEISLYGTCQT